MRKGQGKARTTDERRKQRHNHKFFHVLLLLDSKNPRLKSADCYFYRPIRGGFSRKESPAPGARSAMWGISPSF
jgi:hypothetical protein